MECVYIITYADVLGNHILFATLEKERVASALENYPFFFQDEIDLENVLFNLDMLLRMDDNLLTGLASGHGIGGQSCFKLHVRNLE